MGPAATATYKGNPSERYRSRHNTSFQLSDKNNVIGLFYLLSTRLGALSGACTAYYRYTEMNCVSKKSDWDACGIVAT